MRDADQPLVFPMPDLAQAGKKEGRTLTSKERVASLVGRTVAADLANAVVAMPVAVRLWTGNVQENATAHTFLGHTASRSLPRRILTGLAAGDGLKRHGALVTGPLNDVEKGRILMSRAQQVVIATDFVHGRWREGHPLLISPTEEPCMQTTIVQGHRLTLSALP